MEEKIKSLEQSATLCVMCSLSKRDLLPKWAYYIDWMSEETKHLVWDTCHKLKAKD